VYAVVLFQLDCVLVAVFRLVADANDLVSEHQLHALLHECIQIPRQLGEIAAFGGSNVEPSIRSCLEKVSVTACWVV